MLKKANKPKLKNDKKTISEPKRIYAPVCTNVRSANKKVVFTFSNICNLCWSDYSQLVYVYAKRLGHIGILRQTNM